MDQTDEALLEAAARGDGDAFAVFYRRHLPGVTGFFRRRVGTADLAFDLAAETCLSGTSTSRATGTPSPDWRS